MGVISPNSAPDNSKVKKTNSFFYGTDDSIGWFPRSSSAAPSNAGLTGVFGHRLFELRNKPRSVWLVRESFHGRPANRVAQGVSGSWVSCSLPSFLWTSIRKNGRRKGEKVRDNYLQIQLQNAIVYCATLPKHPIPSLTLAITSHSV